MRTYLFTTPVYDSYGHLERTVAISQCPSGRYHIHADYGFVQLIKPEGDCQVPIRLEAEQSVAEVVGTSLHNLSMPLIRYRTGDLVIVDSRQTRCPCGRAFPIIHSIVGRTTDVGITPDKRAITALYVALDRIPNVACAQIVQESLDTLAVNVVPISRNVTGLDDLIVKSIHAFTGTKMKVVVRHCQVDDLHVAKGRKLQTVVSQIDPALLLS